MCKDQLGKMSLAAGLKSPPPLQKKTIGKMGLKGVPGLVIATGGEAGSKPQPPAAKQTPGGRPKGSMKASGRPNGQVNDCFLY